MHFQTCFLVVVMLAPVLSHGSVAARVLHQSVTDSESPRRRLEQALISTYAGGNLADPLQGCTDIIPPGGMSCTERKANGDCNSEVTTSRNFCAATCGRCTPSVAAFSSTHDLAQPPPASASPATSPPPSPAQQAEVAQPATSPSPYPEPQPVPAPKLEPEPSTDASALQKAAAPTSVPEAEAEASTTGASDAASASAPAPEPEILTPAPSVATDASQPSTPAPKDEKGTTFGSGGSTLPPLADQAAAAAPAGEARSGSGSPASNGKGAAREAMVAGSGETYRGDGTAYSEAVNNTGKGFACSYRYLNDWASVHFAAINLPQWDNGNSCGKCATVRCVDERCTVRNKNVPVMIVDQCPECKHGDIDLSIPIYREITGLWPHRLTVEWQWADCSALINGTIKMYPKDGSNPFWQAFYFANMKYPLKSVTLNGRELIRSQFQFFQHTAPLGDGPHKFVFQAENGMRVTAFSDNPLKDIPDGQDLGVQF